MADPNRHRPKATVKIAIVLTISALAAGCVGPTLDGGPVVRPWLGAQEWPPGNFVEGDMAVADLWVYLNTTWMAAITPCESDPDPLPQNNASPLSAIGDIAVSCLHGFSQRMEDALHVARQSPEDARAVLDNLTADARRSLGLVEEQIAFAGHDDVIDLAVLYRVSGLVWTMHDMLNNTAETLWQAYLENGRDINLENALRQPAGVIDWTYNVARLMETYPFPSRSHCMAPDDAAAQTIRAVAQALEAAQQEAEPGDNESLATPAGRVERMYQPATEMANSQGWWPFLLGARAYLGFADAYYRNVSADDTIGPEEALEAIRWHRSHGRSLTVEAQLGPLEAAARASIDEGFPWRWGRDIAALPWLRTYLLPELCRAAT